MMNNHDVQQAITGLRAAAVRGQTIIRMQRILLASALVLLCAAVSAYLFGANGSVAASLALFGSLCGFGASSLRLLPPRRSK